MVKYFLDTEFIEGKQDKTIFGFKYGESKPTIDFISIGIISEDNREYYAISKDFNLKESWNRYQMKEIEFTEGAWRDSKEYWIREHMLKPIFDELKIKSLIDLEYIRSHFYTYGNSFTYKHLKDLIKWYGKTSKQIAEEVKDFVYKDVYHYQSNKVLYANKKRNTEALKNLYPDNVSFYTYYGAYDWVVFCWLFGKMIELPGGFPMYSNDLKQMIDEKAIRKDLKLAVKDSIPLKGLDQLKQHPNYPRQENEHNALSDARWNKKLYEFIVRT